MCLTFCWVLGHFVTTTKASWLIFNWALRVCQAPILSVVSINFPFCRWRHWGSESWSNMQLVSGRGGTWTWAWHLTPERCPVSAHRRTSVSPTPSTSEDGGMYIHLDTLPACACIPFQRNFFGFFFCITSGWQSHSHDGLKGHLVWTLYRCDLEPHWAEMTCPGPMTG